MTAYISDCTSPGSRATVFSRYTGTTYAAFSIGPLLGGYLIRSGIGSQPQSVTAVFWTAVSCALVNFFLSLYVFPESLSKEKKAAYANQHLQEQSAKGKSRVIEEPEGSRPDSVPTPNRQPRWFLHQFIDPLRQLLPVVITDSHGIRRKDWSLTCLGMSLFLYFLGTGIYQLKYYYAGHTYGWNAEQLSYYISAMGGVRALTLLLLLPFILTTFKPKRESQPPVGNASSCEPTKPKLTKSHLAQEIEFDLSVAKISLGMDFLSNALVTLIPAPRYKVHDVTSNATGTIQSQTLFILASSLAGVGSGIVPAIQSLALCVLQARALITGTTDAMEIAENGVGKLLGALSVLQALGQMIAGPLLFGLIYSQTVAVYPKAMFVLAAGIIVIALICIFLVANPLPRRSVKGKRPIRIPVDDDDEVERGRSRTSKDLFGNNAH